MPHFGVKHVRRFRQRDGEPRHTARKMKTDIELDTNGEAPERGPPHPLNEMYATEGTQIGMDSGSVGDFLCLV